MLRDPQIERYMGSRLPRTNRREEDYDIWKRKPSCAFVKKINKNNNKIKNFHTRTVIVSTTGVHRKIKGTKTNCLQRNCNENSNRFIKYRINVQYSLCFLTNKVHTKHDTYNTIYIHYTPYIPKSLVLELNKKV